MAGRIYRLLLRLLPRHRRRRYGAAMSSVFDELASSARRSGGTGAVGVLLMKELAGLVRFSLRERFTKRALRRASGPRGGWNPAGDLRWAWRGVRARGWQAACMVALVGIALGANTVVFSVADSLAFRRVGFPDPDRLVILQGHDPASGRTITGMPSDLIEPWRAHRDLFSAVHGQTGTTVLLGRAGEPVNVRGASVTPGLLEMLGAAPIAGRLFTDADRGAEAQSIAVIREDLAREHFGDPESAVGQTLDAATGPLFVVGVLPESFRFPGGADRIWLPRDLARRFDGRVPSLFSIARMAPGVGLDQLRQALAERSPAVTAGTAVPRGWNYLVAPTPLAEMYGEAPLRVYWFLLAAAMCLLLTACASVASIELASAVARARTYAIASALGATRARLVRTVVVEAALLAGAAVVAAVAMASAGVTLVAGALPESITVRSANAIDLDLRALGFMAVAAGVAWLVSALPVALFATRQQTTTVLAVEGRTGTGSRGAAAVRRALTAAQVAAAVCLLIGAGLGVRSYTALVTLDRGFDGTNLVSLQVTVPPSMPRTRGALEATSAQVLERLRGLPAVLSASVASSVPPVVGGERHAGPVEIEGRAEPAGMAIVTRNFVTPEYFATLRLPLRAGRVFVPDDEPAAVVVSESFAGQFWPGENAVGRRFRQAGDRDWFEVIGVTPRVRNEFDRLGQPSRVEHEVYFQAAEPSLEADTSAAPSGREATFWSLRFPVRLDDLSALDGMLQAVRALDTRLLVRADVVDDLYRLLETDTRVATSVVTAFGALAFGIALAGVYGVMAFLVAGRRREIAIRMALGADRADVSRHVLGSALRFVGAGVVVGLAAAWAASRVVESQLFGVSATDRVTYAAVSVVVMAAAMLATWQPASRATRVDPALALKAE